MKKVILVFPDEETLVDFIVSFHLADLPVDFKQLSLKGRLPDELIITACTEYRAFIKRMMEAP